MFDFIIATGMVGVVGICAVFVIVFILAEPGKVISFWGVKFHKRYRIVRPIIWRRTPKSLPENWKTIIQVFHSFDEHHVRDERIFSEAKRLGNLSELKSREVCAEMEKYGLIVYSLNFIRLTKKGIPLANDIYQG